MELHVSMDFACHHCTNSVGVTVKCEGKGLLPGQRALAVVRIPCPTCGAINQVIFEPSGTVHAVEPCGTARPVPEPSLN